MTAAAQQLLSAFDALPEAEQESVLRQLALRRPDVELAEAAGEVPKPSPELVAEIRRRLAALDADPSSGRTWEQVLTRINRGRS